MSDKKTSFEQRVEQLARSLAPKDPDGVEIDRRCAGALLESGARPAADRVMVLADAVRARIDEIKESGLGECSECGCLMDLIPGEADLCRACAAYDEWVDREIDARDLERES